MRHEFLPPGFAFFDHGQYVIGYDVQVAGVGVVHLLELFVVQQVAEQVPEVVGQLAFEVLEREEVVRFLSPRGVDIELYVGAE